MPPQRLSSLFSFLKSQIYERVNFESGNCKKLISVNGSKSLLFDPDNRCIPTQSDVPLLLIWGD
jgi:hypothetical protein